APVAVIAALFNHGGTFVKKFRWEFLLLLLLLLLCLLPTAGVFRWSFRWLPFFHLVLALCAAEALHELAQDRHSIFARPGTIAFVLLAILAITLSIFHLGGKYAFPLTWIFLAIAAAWMAVEIFFGRDAALRRPGQRSALSLPQTWMPA